MLPFLQVELQFRIDLTYWKILSSQMYFLFRKWIGFKEWVKRSFGVFHGDAHWDIKFRFLKKVAKRAEKVQFHPTQKINHGGSRTLVLEMEYRGHRELIHELCILFVWVM